MEMWIKLRSREIVYVVFTNVLHQCRVGGLICLSLELKQGQRCVGVVRATGVVALMVALMAVVTTVVVAAVETVALAVVVVSPFREFDFHVY